MTRQFFILFVVFVGGGIGSAFRHAVNQASAEIFGLNFPYGTLFVNLVGSFIIGLIAGWFAIKGGASQTLRLFLATGIIGGFTTFSAFTLDAALLWERGQTAMAVFYVFGTLIAGVLSVFAGLAAARQLV